VNDRNRILSDSLFKADTKEILFGEQKITMLKKGNYYETRECVNVDSEEQVVKVVITQIRKSKETVRK
jgi:hypothetical protein